MRKLLILGLIFLLALSAACGGGESGGSAAKVKGEAKYVATFLDDIFQKGDLGAAYEMLSGGDRAMLGMMPGFFDFITGKDTEAMPDDMKLMRVVVEEFTPVPSNLIRYEVGEAVGQGDTVVVPVTFYVPKENMETFFKENIDSTVYNQLENMEDSDLTYDQKKELITRAAKEVKDAIKGKTFEMQANTNDLTLVKEDGKWKLSIIGSGLMNAFSGM